MEPYLGEIKMFSMAWAPRNWLQCNGQMLPVTQNQALFSLIGITYGGDGKTTFALPDLRGRVPQGMGVSLGNTLGSLGGEETFTLDASKTPAHSHNLNVTTEAGDHVNATTCIPASVGTVAGHTPIDIYATGPLAATLVHLSSNTISVAGGGLGHNNMQAFAVLNFYICVIGSYPQRP